MKLSEKLLMAMTRVPHIHQTHLDPPLSTVRGQWGVICRWRDGGSGRGVGEGIEEGRLGMAKVDTRSYPPFSTHSVPFLSSDLH